MIPGGEKMRENFGEWMNENGKTPLFELFGADPEKYSEVSDGELELSQRAYNTLNRALMGWDEDSFPTVADLLRLTPEFIFTRRNVGKTCTIEIIEKLFETTRG